MKKLLNFMRSMTFGLILLGLVALCSVAGSLILQGESVSYYASTYQSLHGVILMLKLNNIFESWYFAALLVLLCLNLILCSLTRITKVVKAGRRLSESAAAARNETCLSEAGLEKLKEFLRERHFEAVKVNGTEVYTKNRIGRYGTFIVHLSILLTVLFGAAALYLPKVTDRECFPGDALTLEDGAVIFVDSFRIEDADGKLDYCSNISITLPDGSESGLNEIRVNHPLSFGTYKVYQQTYGTAGLIAVEDMSVGISEDYEVTEGCFFSIDGVNGLFYNDLYPAYVEDEDGTTTLISSVQGSYADPVYDVTLLADGVFTPVLAFPGDELQVGGMKFTFKAPVEYPGLRIKYTPPAVNALLVAVFVLMLTGLYITFFAPFEQVKTDGEGYAVIGAKAEGLRLELAPLLRDYAAEKVKEMDAE